MCPTSFVYVQPRRPCVVSAAGRLSSVDVPSVKAPLGRRVGRHAFRSKGGLWVGRWSHGEWTPTVLPVYSVSLRVAVQGLYVGEDPVQPVLHRRLGVLGYFICRLQPLQTSGSIYTPRGRPPSPADVADPPSESWFSPLKDTVSCVHRPTSDV